MNGNRLWMLGTTMAVLAIVALGWLLGISPKLAEASAAAAERQNVTAQNAAQDVALVKLRDQFTHLSTLKASLADLQEEVPERPDVEGFIDELKELADRTGVALTNIAATEATAFESAPTEGATPTPADADSAADQATTPGPSPDLSAQLFTVAVAITVTGSPDQVLDFTSAVQEGKRFFLANSVSFASGEGEGAGGTLSGYLFVVRPPGTIPAAATPADPSAVAAPAG